MSHNKSLYCSLTAPLKTLMCKMSEEELCKSVVEGMEDSEGGEPQAMFCTG